MLSRWMRDRSAAAAIEYGFLAGIAALALIVGTGALAPTPDDGSGDITGSIQSRPGPKQDREPVLARQPAPTAVVTE